MTRPFAYAPPDRIVEGPGGVVLEGEEARHLARSLRVRPGETIMVADGTGIVHSVTITEVEGDTVRGTSTARRLFDPPVPEIVLFQSVSRPQRMDIAVARSAESGVCVLVPVTSRRSARMKAGAVAGRAERWRRIALEASKVAQRPLPLVVAEEAGWPLDERSFARCELLLVLWEEERSRCLADALPTAPPASVGFLVGPEGGLEEEEVAELTSLGALAVTLGDLVLRTESAGAHCAMLVRYHYGCLRPAAAFNESGEA
ncbi:MAG: RsmE family RNA methyltransferase [Actinobacteria bacterium]|nr:RsmE family RNA methyltransferase [Actinomycetota bacterium]